MALVLLGVSGPPDGRRSGRSHGTRPLQLMSSSLAGFWVTLYGRIGVTPEDRGQVQSAWGMWLADRKRFLEFDLQQCPEIDDCIEKHIVRAEDAPDFSIPDLVDDKFDAFAPYPIALLRGFK